MSQAPVIASGCAFVVGLAATATILAATTWLSLRHGVWATPGFGGRGQISPHVKGQQFVVAFQLALTLVLLTGASLFAETLIRLEAQPLGFQPENLVLVSTKARWPLSGPPGPSDLSNDSLTLKSLRSIPGVTAAAATSGAPFRGASVSTSVEVDGSPGSRPIEQRVVSESYFDAIGSRLTDGESFAGRPGAAVVSQEFAREFFSGKAVGRSFKARGERFRVVGVVPDVKLNGFRDSGLPIFYTMAGPMYGRLEFVIRAAAPQPALESAQQIIADTLPDSVVTDAVAAEGMIAVLISEERFRARLAGWFAAVALALACVALYGVTFRLAASRSREFGLRMAIGATGADVRRLVLRDTAKFVALGLCAGLPMSFALAGLVQSSVFGVKAYSLHTFAGSCAVLGSVCLLATLGPAIRAGRLSPAGVIRD